MVQAAIVSPDTERKPFRWDVPNNLYGTHVMWPMIPGFTFGQIRSIAAFEVHSSFGAPIARSREECSFDPEWLGLGIMKKGEVSYATIAHWCDDGTAFIHQEFYSQEAVKFFIPLIPELMRYSSIDEGCVKAFLKLVEPQLASLPVDRQRADTVFAEIQLYGVERIQSRLCWHSP